MDHFEKVEKLRQTANITYEEAKVTLEAADWDLLEAVVLLENTGRLNNNANPAFSTKREGVNNMSHEPQQNMKGFFTRLGESLSRWISNGNKNFLKITRKGKDVTEFPLTVVVIILLLALIFFRSIPFIIILFIISLFFGVRYEFRGSQPNSTANRVMDKAAETVEHIQYGVHKDKDK